MSHELLLRLPEVKARTGLSRSTIYNLLASGNFPAAYNLSDRAVGWLESDIDEWIKSRPRAARVIRTTAQAQWRGDAVSPLSKVR